MKPKVYIETTIISYLIAKPSRDLLVAAHQQVTREWWERRRPRFDLFASKLVLDEAGAGDAEAADERLRELTGVRLLGITRDAVALAEALVRGGALPKKAQADGLHIAVTAIHRMTYLLTWNCRHLANAEARPALTSICASRGYDLPLICTPEELMGD